MLHFTICVDPALGRLDYSSMSTQALMEMFIEGLTAKSKENFQDDQGNYLDIEDWPGFTCESDDIEIGWISMHLEGSLAYQFMPPRTIIFLVQIGQRAIRSSLETADLPRGLQHFIAQRQAHFGTLDMTSLPPALISFDVWVNIFEGTINLTALPSNIKNISISYNKLSGSIDISALPESLKKLYLDHNNLSGTILFESLPANSNKTCARLVQKTTRSLDFISSNFFYTHSLLSDAVLDYVRFCHSDLILAFKCLHFCSKLTQHLAALIRPYLAIRT